MKKIAMLFCFFALTPPLVLGFSPFSFLKAPCMGTPALGTVCNGGAIYAGQFDSGKYMITPGNCTDSAFPTCNGGEDSLSKYWRGSTGSNSDISGVENVTVQASPSSSSFRGHVNTPVIVAHASVSSNSAADYCNDMVYGSYNDWYLPSKSELAYIYCHTATATPQVWAPEEDANCVSYGRGTEIPGFKVSNYWTSTEFDASQAVKIWMASGNEGYATKGVGGVYVRCVRRY